MRFRSLLMLTFVCCAVSGARAQPGDDERVRAPEADERQMIGEYVRAHLAPLRACYDRRTRVRPALQGRLMARFDIAASGKVDRASADGMQDRDLIDCVVGEIEKWEFSNRSGG